MSLPESVMVFAVSSAVVTVCAVAEGASLTALTLTVTVAGVENKAPSLTLKVKVSVPLKLPFGM